MLKSPSLLAILRNYLTFWVPLFLVTILLFSNNQLFYSHCHFRFFCEIPPEIFSYSLWLRRFSKRQTYRIKISKILRGRLNCEKWSSKTMISNRSHGMRKYKSTDSHYLELATRSFNFKSLTENAENTKGSSK